MAIHADRVIFVVWAMLGRNGQPPISILNSEFQNNSQSKLGLTVAQCYIASLRQAFLGM